MREFYLEQIDEMMRWDYISDLRNKDVAMEMAKNQMQTVISLINEKNITNCLSIIDEYAQFINWLDRYSREV